MTTTFRRVAWFYIRGPIVYVPLAAGMAIAMDSGHGIVAGLFALAAFAWAMYCDLRR